MIQMFGFINAFDNLFLVFKSYSLTSNSPLFFLFPTNSFVLAKVHGGNVSSLDEHFIALRAKVESKYCLNNSNNNNNNNNNLKRIRNG